MKTFCALLMILISWSSLASASPKTVLISDIDDTIKLAYSFGYGTGIYYMRDTQSRFTGMSELYAMLSRDNDRLGVFYVSLASSFLMKNVHLEFLKNARFPEGRYFPRTEYSADSHKLETIRAILRQEKPERVIMVGDDSQADAAVYHTISQDPEFAGMTFDQFIHIVSSEGFAKGKSNIHSEQVGFLTSMELATEMAARHLIEEKSLNYLMRAILPRILAEEPGQNDSVESAFPYFVNCRALEWKWNIPGLNERVKKICHLP